MIICLPIFSRTCI